MVFLCIRRTLLPRQTNTMNSAQSTAGTSAAATTVLPDKKQHNMLTVPVLFLDDTVHVFYIGKRAKGSALINQVFKHVELSEKDYFGLQFMQQPGDVIRWLDPNKAFRKQWPHKLPALPPPFAHTSQTASIASNTAAVDSVPAQQPPFHFRVKFYVSDPSRLQEEYTRYQFYLQIKRDIWTGLLPCPVNTACLLASYTVQAELGDYSAIDHGATAGSGPPTAGSTSVSAAAHLAGMPLLREQTVEMERRIGELHKLHRGQLPADAEYNYLEHAKKLYMYGVDMHRATDSGGKDISLGVTSLGLVVYQNAVRMNVFSWSKMVKISFKRKDFFIQLRREPSENYDTLLGFGMFSHKRAKALWKSCVEHHSFFRLERPNRLPRFLPLSLGSRFYYSGRTEVQAVQESRQRAPISKVFMRSPSKRLLALQTATDPTSAVNTIADGNGGAAGGTSTSTMSETTPPNGGGFSSGAGAVGGIAAGGAENGRVFRRAAYRPHSDGHRVQTVLGPTTLPRKAWEQQSDDEGGFIARCAKSYDAPGGPLSDAVATISAPISTSDQHLMQQRSVTPILAAHHHQQQQQQQRLKQLKQKQFLHGTPPVDLNDPALVTIRLQADEQGRFGFNVRGGIDLKLPVLVSRVAPHTPADRTVPRICEGDQVVLINGHDVSDLMHEDVVALIRASREQRNGEQLVLTVKPNAFVDPSEEEPLCQYVPDIGGYNGISLLHGDALFSQSLLLLSDGLASGALLSQYEQMYRKNATLAITEARKAENATKNRYRDISPYDCTRVVLINADSGDYINANYVNMEIPADGVNRYIATQGPLPNTTVDFWRMVQQESSHLIVMLTTVMERGRPKCHQYWPAAGDELRLSETFSVRCQSETADETGSFVYRELQMNDRVTGEKRAIQHMQYLAWPDHGVPSDPELFLQFTQKMRALRKTSLLQEIDMSLAKMRLMDDDDEDDDDDDDDEDDDDDDDKNEKLEEKGDNNDEVAAQVKSVNDEKSARLFKRKNSCRRSRRHGLNHRCGGGSPVTATDAVGVAPKASPDEEEAGQSPEEIDLPPSTSIHQFISAANPPIVVHCSAGIGRTGVLILMDTALALMDAKEPVYPLDVVQAMRDQRAFMVQNVGQYRFVCECICVAYAKIARTESIESSASIEDNNVHGDETQANGDTTAVAVVAVTDGIENVNDSRSDAK